MPLPVRHVTTAPDASARVLLDPHARHLFVHWEAEAARVTLGILRSHLVRWPHNQQLKAAIEELCELSPDARRLWDTAPDVAPQAW